MRNNTLLAIASAWLFGGIPGTAASQTPPNYLLGADDQITIQAFGIDEIDAERAMRVDMRGFVNLPMAGRIHVAGLTLEQVETEVSARLKKFVKEPQVVIAIAEFRSQPVSVLGEVTHPGVHQLQGRKMLFEVLSAAGGLTKDAGYSIKITRRAEWGDIPLPDAKRDPSGQFSIATVSTKSVLAAQKPEENIAIQPYDVISVPRAELIYVTGAVRKSGGFVLGESETVSALQALSLAEGLDHASAPKNCKILRAVPGSAERQEITVDLRSVMEGRGTDIPLQADDILFVPTSAAKSAAMRTLEAAIQAGTGIAIYRR